MLLSFFAIIRFITKRCQSRDHSTRGGRLPMGGPLWRHVYLASSRYGVSNVGRTHARLCDSILCTMLCIIFDRQ